MSRPATILLAYRPEGFVALGGIRTLALGIAERLGRDPRAIGWRLATWQSRPDQGDQGRLPGSTSLAWPQRGDRLLVFGCNQPWAYLQVLAVRLLRPSVRVLWLPSFHDPDQVRHRTRARCARRLLQMLQGLGITVLAQTEHEHRLLDAGRCALSNHAMPLEIATAQERPTQADERPVDLLFLGRPTAQKGWPRFLEVVQRTGLRATAIVPSPPAMTAPVGLALELAPDGARIHELLAKAKIVLVPSDYESFGLAQVEAVTSGCLVPVLGCWPLWDGLPLLHWQHCDSEELARRCLRLCRNGPLRRLMAKRQWTYLRGHSVLSAPFLPGL